MPNVLDLNVGEDKIATQMREENIKNRVLVLNEEIDECIIENYVLYILKWNAEDACLPVEARQPITLMINSGGGDCFTGFHLVDVIRQSITPIRAVGLAVVASMAYHIFICCPKRYAFKNTVLLQHDGEIGVQNSTSKAKDIMRFFDNLEERTKQHVLEFTKMDEEFYDKHYDQEYYMYANEEGKKLGCVDYIIGEDCTLDDIL